VLQFKNSALGIIAGTSGALIAPPASVTPAQWAAANLIVPDGPRANEKWSAISRLTSSSR
jgi:hypothetical protein